MPVRRIVTYIFNLSLVVMLCARVIAVNNDKSPAIFIVGYGLIILYNLSTWGISSLFKAEWRHEFGSMLKILALLFIPLLIIIVLF